MAPEVRHERLVRAGEAVERFTHEIHDDEDEGSGKKDVSVKIKSLELSAACELENSEVEKLKVTK